MSMKKLLTLLLTLLLFNSSFAEVRVVSELEYKAGMPYAIGESVPFSGQLVKHHNNGKKKSATHYNQGWIDGVKTVYYSDGAKRYETNYKHDKKHGIETHWHENGQKKLEVTYVDNHKQGRETNWYKNGKKESEELNKYNDRSTKFKNGIWITWYDNGQIKSKGAYKQVSGKPYDDKIKDGKWIKWHKNGNKTSEVEYRDGHKIGLEATYYYLDGQKKSEATYKDGYKVGTETTWYSTGKKRSKTQWGQSEGSWDKNITFDENGQITYEKNRSFENKIVPWLEENQYGILIFCLFIIFIKGLSSIEKIGSTYFIGWFLSLVTLSGLVYFNYMVATMAGSLFKTNGPTSETYWYFLVIYIGIFVYYLSLLKVSKTKKAMSNLILIPLFIFFLSFVGCTI